VTNPVIMTISSLEDNFNWTHYKSKL